MSPSSSRRIGGVDPASDPMAPPEYVVRAIVDGLDRVAHAMERKWGIGCLRLLVTDLLRAKFDAQKDKLDAAIESGSERYVRIHADGMKRAWVALDKAATEGGHKPLSPEIWECVLPASGEVVAIVRDLPEAHRVCREGRVFTLAEIGRLIEGLGDAAPGVRSASTFSMPAAAPAKPPIDWSRGDDIPF